MADYSIRPIASGDNAGLAQIVRSSLAEFGANKPGTVYFDPTTDHLYELFQEEGAAYFVAEKEGHMLGGAGIIHSEGLPPDTCELAKMYLRPEARGLGIGGALIRLCIDKARASGYGKIYLESMPELSHALAVYTRFGFRMLDGPLGNTGHFGCDCWMLLDLPEVNR